MGVLLAAICFFLCFCFLAYCGKRYGEPRGKNHFGRIGYEKGLLLYTRRARGSASSDGQ